ncbi:MFS transporter [Sphaerimonospora thailandensis]|uniref:Putative MFS-type transporter YddS n=1 Tax=Sphaerimonospora thailandensis TaxID=795644 RepID=A0A8J3RA41_9ACTN|nr:MFS transporter [Sphaerimonospora thailandensis]GIH71243.1 putative MFS-type transporter YddS [Sphaerimonospora thailandensis]
MGGLGRIGVLVVANLLGGVGVAAGVAVGALLIEAVGGTTMAGLGSAANVLGAAVAAVPLAAVASRHGRRWSLTLGYALAAIGGALIIAAAVISNIVVLLAALAFFGVAQAVNLQTRYAAADDVPPATQARAMSTVIWATTIGSVAGPNLSEVGDRLGVRLGLPVLSGPYLFSVLSFVLAAAVVALLFRPAVRPREAAAAGSAGSAGTEPTVGAMAALRWAAAHPTARFAVVLIAAAHAVMITVMVMTPLHLQHHGMTLQVVGIVISLHILGMYGFSPVFGWLADRLGVVRVAFGGIAMLSVALVLGFLAAATPAGGALTAVALTVLGVGWSASVISASALLTSASPARVRVPLQGVTDAGMSYAGAVAAALAGPILAFGGFHAVNIAAAVILVPAVVAGAAALRGRGADAESPSSRGVTERAS